ncbi:MAG TPA: hypothetical protein VFD00_12240 [Thermoclostridium sp.]|nr:hypothetical protein [Thermoclostridium sp.]
MTNYRVYTGELPSFEIIQSGGIYQIMFNFIDVEHVDEEGNASSEKHCKCDVIEVEVLDYSTIVASIVRSKYSQDDVEAILSNYQLCKDGEAETKYEEYTDKYNAYQDYRVYAKSIARDVLNK